MKVGLKSGTIIGLNCNSYASTLRGNTTSLSRFCKNPRVKPSIRGFLHLAQVANPSFASLQTCLRHLKLKRFFLPSGEIKMTANQGTGE